MYWILIFVKLILCVIPVKLFAWFINLIAVGMSYVINSLIFLLSGQYLQFVDEFKYLGRIFHHDSTDDCDIMREIRNLYSRIN